MLFARSNIQKPRTNTKAALARVPLNVLSIKEVNRKQYSSKTEGNKERKAVETCSALWCLLTNIQCLQKSLLLSPKLQDFNLADI